MLSFKFLFGLLLAEKILRHTDKLSTTLQQPEMSAVEAHRTAMLSVQTQKKMRNEAHFDLFWELAACRWGEFLVEEHSLPRLRKRPRRLHDGADAEFPESAKDHYRVQYYEALDLAVTSITTRFDQKGYHTFSKVEQLLF